MNRDKRMSAMTKFVAAAIDDNGGGQKSRALSAALPSIIAARGDIMHASRLFGLS